MKTLILLLGAPNDEQGGLSQIAVERGECAYYLYAANDNVNILCTGGFGEHFNTTTRPHAFYAKAALMKKGAREEDFLPFVLSANTYEDIEKARPVIEKAQPDLLIIVTSDFHMERVRLLQERILNYPNVLFVPARSGLPAGEMEGLVAHEQRAIERIKNWE